MLFIGSYKAYKLFFDKIEHSGHFIPWDSYLEIFIVF